MYNNSEGRMTLSPEVCPQVQALCLKVTASRDGDGLFVRWVDRTQLRDGPLVVFKTFPCIFSNFTFFGGIADRLPLCTVYQWGTFLKMCQRLLATLWQIYNRASVDFGKPLVTLSLGSRGYW
jgi:hypothetical protein